MAKGKRPFFFWFFLVVSSLIVLFILTLIVLPYLLNLNLVKSKISYELEKRYQISTQIGSLSLSLLPRPKVVLKETKISSDTFKAYLPIALTYPKLWPLLQQKVEIDAIILEKTQLKTFIKTTPKSKSLNEIIKNVSQKLEAFAFRTNIKLKDASLELLKEGEPFLKANSINLAAAIEDSQILLETNFTTPFSQEVFIKGRINLLAGFEGKAHLKNLRLEHLPFIPLNWEIAKTKMDLELTFEGESPTRFNLGFNLFLPYFIAKSEELSLEGGFIQGSLLRKEKLWQLRLSKLEFKDPQIKGHGFFTIDPKENRIAYNFKGQKLDIAGLRNLLVSFFPKNKDLKTVFSIILGGKLQNLTLSQSVRTKKELKGLENFVIKTQVNAAEVNIPEIGLKIKNGQGEITLREGILYGENITGSIDGAKVSKASIAIGIYGPKEILNITTNFSAPLKTGLFFLKKFVKTDFIQKELELIPKAEGSLCGKLSINGNFKAIDVVLKASLVKGKIIYQRLPYETYIDNISFSYAQKRISWHGLKGHLGHSFITDSKGEIDFSGPKVFLNVENFSAKLVAQELNPWLKEISFVKPLLHQFDFPKGDINISLAQFSYKFDEPASLSYKINLIFKDCVFFLSFFPKKVQIESGNAFISSKLISFNNIKGKLEEGRFLVSGEIKDPFIKKREIKLFGNAKVTPFIVNWIYKSINLPSRLKIKAPATIESFNLVYSPKNTHLDLIFLNPQMITVKLSLDYLSKRLFIKDAYIKEDSKQCYLSLDLDWQKEFSMDVDFKGTISPKTLDAIFIKNIYLGGIFTGEMKGQVDFSRLWESEFNGHLFIEELGNINGYEGVIIDQLSLKANGKEIDIKKVNLSFKDTHLKGDAKVRFKEEFLKIDGKIFTPLINFDEIRALFAKKDNKTSSPINQTNLLNKKAKGDTNKTKVPKIRADVETKIDSLKYHDFIFNGIEALISFKEPKEVEVRVLKGDYCDLGLTGIIKSLNDKLKIELSFQGEKQDLNKFFYCLSKKKDLFKAHYSLKGEFQAEGGKKLLEENSRGYFEFYSEKGRIFRFSFLAKIFSLLNVLEILKGKLPDLNGEGFYYNDFDINAHLKNGILDIDSAIIDSPSIKIVGQGTLDILTSEVEMTVLVAPLKTIDTVLSNIPVLGGILTGKNKILISVPLKVKGPIKDPNVMLIPPSAAGEGILGIMKRVIDVPFKILNILPKTLENLNPLSPK